MTESSDGEWDSDDFSSGYACSLMSEISSTATCDDLPGPGRTLDKYFFQPAGKWVERKVEEFVISRRLKKERNSRSENRDMEQNSTHSIERAESSTSRRSTGDSMFLGEKNTILLVQGADNNM